MLVVVVNALTYAPELSDMLLSSADTFTASQPFQDNTVGGDLSAGSVTRGDSAAASTPAATTAAPADTSDEASFFVVRPRPPRGRK